MVRFYARIQGEMVDIGTIDLGADGQSLVTDPTDPQYQAALDSVLADPVFVAGWWITAQEDPAQFLTGLPATYFGSAFCCKEEEV